MQKQLLGKRPLAGSEWDMGWLTKKEWDVLTKIEELRTVKINSEHHYVIFHRGSTPIFECHHARIYWINRLRMITAHYPSFGNQDIRMERVYPKLQKIISSLQFWYEPESWHVLLSCGHNTWIDGRKNNPIGDKMMCPKENCLKSYYPEGETIEPKDGRLD
jgi:hypothetical protein